MLVANVTVGAAFVPLGPHPFGADLLFADFLARFRVPDFVTVVPVSIDGACTLTADHAFTVWSWWSRITIGRTSRPHECSGDISFTWMVSTIGLAEFFDGSGGHQSRGIIVVNLETTWLAQRGWHIVLMIQNSAHIGLVPILATETFHWFAFHQFQWHI